MPPALIGETVIVEFEVPSSEMVNVTLTSFTALFSGEIVLASGETVLAYATFNAPKTS